MPQSDTPPETRIGAEASGGRDRTVLIVDDEPQVLAALRDLLGDDFRVITRTSPTEALEDVRADPSIAVVLSDQRMPEMAGDELLSRIRDLSYATRLLITGYSDLEAVVRAINEGGIFAYISKPWDPKGLRITVLRAAEQFELVLQLAHERALIQDLTDSIPDALYFKDRDHRYLRINQPEAEVLGIDNPRQALGTTVGDFLDSGRADMRHAEERRILETGEPLRERIEQVVRPDGSLAWYAATKAAMRDEPGAISGIVGITRDVTDRAQGERERDLLLEVTHGFFEVDSFDGAIGSVLRLVCERTGWDYGEAWGWDEDSGRLRPFPAFHAKQEAYREFQQYSAGFAYAPGEGMPGRIWSSQAAEWLENVENETCERYLRREKALAVELRASVGVPVPSRSGPPLAVLMFFLARARKEDAGHMRLVEAVAQKLGQALEAKRDEDAVRSREENLRTVLDNQTEMVTRLEPDGRHLYANPATARFHGVPVEAMESLTVWNTISRGDQEPLRRFWASLTPEQPTGTITLRMRRHDAELRHIEWTERGIFDEDGTLQEIQGAGRDVTDRLIAENEAGLAHGRLLAAIESVPAGFAVFDKDQRLVICNDLYRTERPAHLRDLIVPGVSLEEIVRRTAEAGSYADTEEDVEALVARRMERWRNRPLRHEQKFSDGRWREIMEFPTPEGGTVLLRNDITAKKQAEMTLRQSERRFRDFAECASDWMWETDSEGRFTYFSGRVTEVLGYEISELIGIRRRDLIAQDGMPRHIGQIEEALHRQQPFRDREYELVAKDGSKHVVVVSGMPVIGEDGAFLGYRGTGSDVTQREETLAALKLNEERFHEIAETIRDVFWVSDPNKQRMMYVSPAYEDIWGTSPQELYDNPTSFMDTIHEDDIDRVREAIARQADGLYYEEEFRIRRPDGEERWIRDRGYPVHDADGRLVRVIGVAQDITAQRRLERQYQQAQKMEAVGQLTGGIAHDFNNLLTVVMGNLQFLEKRLNQGDDEKLKKWASNAHRAATRGADLTRRLLAFSSRQVLEPVVLDVNDAVRDMMDMLARVIGEDVELVAPLSDDIGAIRTDPAQFESMILNLAVNARDAMPGGGRLVIETSRILLGENDDKVVPDIEPGSYVTITVTDTGVGMPPEVRDKVFEPFFTTKETGKGSGLGLSMVFGFVKQSGGQVGIYSEVGHGTTVKLYFPCAAAAERKDAAVAEPPVHRPSTAAVVLVVEDNESVRETAESMLEILGYRALTAGDGRTALDLLKKHPEIDVLFTDIVMPGSMTGVELAWQARTLRPGLPVLYTSGYAEAALKKTGGAEADARWLAKPYTVGQLAVKLGEAMRS